MSNLTSVIFVNQPKLSEHIVDQAFNEQRIALIEKIKTYISNHYLFDHKVVTVTFFHNGISSLVCLVDNAVVKYVLKIQLRAEGPKGEAKFLKAWMDIGISVPKVYEIGFIDKQPYILMEYISAKTLDNDYSEKDLIEKKLFFQMGQVLKNMHTTVAKGYGRMIEGEVGEYDNFRDWLLMNPMTKNQINYVTENNLLSEEIYGSLDAAFKIFEEHIYSDPSSTYCHFDFCPQNILNTNPLTVFDPVPNFNHPYMDLAKAIVHTGCHYSNSDVIKQLLDGYFEGRYQSLNLPLIQASVLFISYTKFPYWHKTSETQKMDKIKDILLRNSYLSNSIH